MIRSHGFLIFFRNNSRRSASRFSVVNLNHNARELLTKSETRCKRAHVYSNSASLVLLVPRRLVPPQRLPAHRRVVPLQQPIPLSTHPPPRLHPRTPLLRRRRKPLVNLPVCSRRWQPPQAPLLSVRLSAMASHPCSLVVVLKLRQLSNSSKQLPSKTRLLLRRIVRRRPRSSPSVSIRPTCRAVHGTSNSSRP